MISFSFTESFNLDEAFGKMSEIPFDPMGGWFKLPNEMVEKQDLIDKIKATAAKINENSEYLVCIGIGGSYLGYRAIIEALGDSSKTKILYAGNSLGSISMKKILDELADHDFSICVISKSGTTVEPAVAFRILKQKIIEKYGEEEAYRRIYAITDGEKGALHDEALANHYETFTIPPNIGGRFSVLSVVGLLPMAVAGISIDEFLDGAREESASLATASPAALRYALARHILQKQNYDVEVLASFDPEMHYFGEWWKQLFGESEGKNRQGIFPATVSYTTDLHSMGQYMQEGRRNIFETVLMFKNSFPLEITVPSVENSLDNLGYLEGKSLDFINRQALAATVAAHKSGGIPVLGIGIPDFTAKSFGALFYFFEIACAVSAKLSKVNPFDQPGVEAYKKEMQKLLSQSEA